MNPKKVAVIAVKKMFARKAEVIPGFINKLSIFLFGFFQKTLSEKLVAKNL